MRRLVRRKLSAETAAYLDQQTALIVATPKPARKALVKKLWKQAKKTKPFTEVLRKLRKTASGLRRCMYCEDSRGVAVDHFWPLSDYPGKAFRWTNYLYACSYCNSHKKRDQFPRDPVTGRPLLIKPTRDDPDDHLTFVPRTGQFAPRRGSVKALPTIKVFGLNSRPELVKGREGAFIALESLLVDYAEQKKRGRDAQANRIKQTVKGHAFSAVFVYLVRVAGSPAASVLRPECLAALRACPEIRSWV